MRTFHRNLCFVAALSFAAACGGDNGGNGGPENEDPVAAFAFTCDLLACTFDDNSTDPDGADDLASWSWDFGGDGESDDQNPTHTFSAAGDYEVTLTVTDDAGATATATETVTVSDTPPVNNPPTAAFTFDCLSLDCSFTDASTDPDAGDVLTWAWDFGDGVTSTQQNPTRSYNVTVPDTFTVTLTVTDEGGETDEATEEIIVAPPAICEGGACDLTLPANASVQIELTEVGCTADGNALRILEPVEATLFEDGCNEPPGTTYDLGTPGQVFTAGTTIVPEVESGSQSLAFPPTLRIRDGTGYPEWILEFDDGEGCGQADPTCGGDEPDFDDLIITITATPE